MCCDQVYPRMINSRREKEMFLAELKRNVGQIIYLKNLEKVTQWCGRMKYIYKIITWSLSLSLVLMYLGSFAISFLSSYIVTLYSLCCSKTITFSFPSLYTSHLLSNVHSYLIPSPLFRTVLILFHLLFLICPLIKSDPRSPCSN